MTTRAGADATQPLAQQGGQQEGAEVVDLEGLLEAVDGDPALHEHEAGVVDEDVQRVEARQQLAGGGAHGVEVRVVAGDDVQVRVAGRGGDLRAGALAALDAATQQRDRRALAGEGQRGLVARGPSSRR